MSLLGEEGPLFIVGKNPAVIPVSARTKRYYRSSERYYRLGGSNPNAVQWHGATSR